MANSTSTSLCWSGSLDISQGTALHGELTAALDAGAPIELDAGEVSRVDTSALQLLHAFFVEAKQQNVPVAWTGCAEVVREVAAMLDLGTTLEMDLGDGPRVES